MFPFLLIGAGLVGIVALLSKQEGASSRAAPAEGGSASPSGGTDFLRALDDARGVIDVLSRDAGLATLPAPLREAVINTLATEPDIGALERLRQNIAERGYADAAQSIGRYIFARQFAGK